MSTALDKNGATEMSPVERMRERPTYRPNVDILERDQELVVLVDVPGAQTDGVDIKFENGTLTIFASVSDRQSEGVRYLHREYGSGDYLRTFAVGEAIDSDNITAEMSHGVLTLHLPKTARVQPRKIEVRAN